MQQRRRQCALVWVRESALSTVQSGALATPLMLPHATARAGEIEERNSSKTPQKPIMMKFKVLSPGCA
jgi:hypothetical protein